MQLLSAQMRMLTVPSGGGVAKGVGVFVIEDEREALVMVSGVDDGDEEEDLGDDMLIDRE